MESSYKVKMTAVSNEFVGGSEMGCTHSDIRLLGGAFAMTTLKASSTTKFVFGSIKGLAGDD